jgi:predicted nuclease of predicted toxin-antitoxin system
LKILIDQNVSARLARLLTGHTATHASAKGWAELTNGDLLTAAEADGFEIFLTSDKNIRYQQNLTGRRIALVVLGGIVTLTSRGQYEGEGSRAVPIMLRGGRKSPDARV